MVRYSVNAYRLIPRFTNVSSRNPEVCFKFISEVSPSQLMQYLVKISVFISKTGNVRNVTNPSNPFYDVRLVSRKMHLV